MVDANDLVVVHLGVKLNEVVREAVSRAQQTRRGVQLVKNIPAISMPDR